MLEQTGSTGAENTSSSSTALPAALPSLMSLGSNEDMSKGEDKKIKKGPRQPEQEQNQDCR